MGLIPLLSVRGRDEMALLGVHSLAQPPKGERTSPLLGRWGQKGTVQLPRSGDKASAASPATRPAAASGRTHVAQSAPDADMAAMLRSLQPRPPAVVLHSFSSGDGVWDAGLAINAYFSFSGMITFKNWTLQPRLSECPADRLLLETDAPYLAPVPHRGRRNEPGFVRDVAARAAELRGETVASLVQQTTANARRCFGSRIDSTL